MNGIALSNGGPDVKLTALPIIRGLSGSGRPIIARLYSYPVRDPSTDPARRSCDRRTALSALFMFDPSTGFSLQTPDQQAPLNRMVFQRNKPATAGRDRQLSDRPVTKSNRWRPFTLRVARSAT